MPRRPPPRQQPAIPFVTDAYAPPRRHVTGFSPTTEDDAGCRRILDRCSPAWVTSPVQRIWFRSPRFDLGLQLGALVGIAPPLLVYAALDPTRASSMLPLVSLI